MIIEQYNGVMVPLAPISFIKKKIVWNIDLYFQDHKIIVDTAKEGRK